MASFGEKLRELREARRMTLRALASAIGVSAPFLSDVEHGRRLPGPENIAAIAKHLGVPDEMLHALDPRRSKLTTEERIARLEARVRFLEDRFRGRGIQ